MDFCIKDCGVWNDRIGFRLLRGGSQGMYGNKNLVRMSAYNICQHDIPKFIQFKIKRSSSSLQGQRILYSVPALVWILSRCQRLWEESICQQVLHIPFGCAFRLPSPKDPPGSSLVGVELRFDKMPEVVFVNVGEIRDGTGSFAVAATVVAVPR